MSRIYIDVVEIVDGEPISEPQTFTLEQTDAGRRCQNQAKGQGNANVELRAMNSREELTQDGGA
jgi:hypothetical protein